MKILIKILILSFSMNFCLFGFKIQAKQKNNQSNSQINTRISGIMTILFPIPVALYNAGCSEESIPENPKKNKDSFFEIFDPGDIKITFEDVAGLDGAKEDMQDIIGYLKDSHKFTKMGAKIPKGILMNGVPGCGKTLLARAFAGEVNCTFIMVNGSDFNSEYMGIGSQKIQELFKAAREHAPTIIFIDEIDAIACARSNSSSGASRDNNQRLNTLLAEMDGFNQNEKPVIVLAATNRIDQLDNAILRPGRFDRIIEITKPLIKDRIQLLRRAFAHSPISSDINFDYIARATIGFSGAELANLVNEAVILAVKDNSEWVCMRHLEMAYDNITLGRETKGMLQGEDDLWNTAIHEAGHLIGYLFQDKTVMVHKVSITPRGKTLGVAHMLPLVESYSFTQEDMKNRIVSCLAGRFAEEAFGFGLSSGSSNDLEKAHQLAYDMVVTYGMGDSLRDISYRQFDGQLPNDIATNIHNEVNEIIAKCRYVTRNLIIDHKDDIEKIARLLMDKGTVQGDEIYRLLNLPQP